MTATLYAATTAGVHKTTDGAQTWRPVNEGLADLEMRALAIDAVTPSTLYAATFIYPATVTSVYKSTDGGISWRPFDRGLSHIEVTALAVDPVDRARVYATTLQNGVYSIQQTGVTTPTPTVTSSPTSTTVPPPSGNGCQVEPQTCSLGNSLALVAGIAPLLLYRCCARSRARRMWAGLASSLRR